MKLGYAAKEVDLDERTGVEEEIEQSGMDGGGCKVTLNGVGADLSVRVKEGDILALVPKVEGGLIES